MELSLCSRVIYLIKDIIPFFGPVEALLTVTALIYLDFYLLIMNINL